MTNTTKDDQEPLKRGAASPAARASICRRVPYGEIQVDRSGAASDSSSGAHPYDSRGKVIMGIRRVLRARRSLVEEDVAAEIPELVNAAKGFFRTWKEACYASGVNERPDVAARVQAYRLVGEPRFKPDGINSAGRPVYTPNHTVELIGKLMATQPDVTSGDFMKAYGAVAYVRMLKHFGRFAKALAATVQKLRG